MNPFLSFCLYVAARVFTHALKRTPDDETIRTNLEFLLITMQAHRRKNNLTESFLVQLIIELEAAGLPNPLNKTRHPLLPPRRAVSYSNGDCGQRPANSMLRTSCVTLMTLALLFSNLPRRRSQAITSCVVPRHLGRPRHLCLARVITSASSTRILHLPSPCHNAMAGLLRQLLVQAARLLQTSLF